MSEVLDGILDAFIDTLKIVPFLFLTYLIMEYIEHKITRKSKEVMKRADRYGPLVGGILGLIPQCGFSAASANLYAGRVITLRNINVNILINI